MRYTRLAVLVLGVALVAPAFALEVPLRYSAYPQDLREFRPYGNQHVRTVTTVPEGDWKLPPLVAKVPLYGLVEFGDSKYLMVLDFANANDKFYSRILFDANANRDLTDDPVVDGKCNWADNNQYAFIEMRQAVDVEFTLGGAKVKYSFRPQANAWFPNSSVDLSKPENLQNITVYLRTNCSYSGEFDLDGVHYGVELGDRNANGRFNDIAEVPAEMRGDDRLYAQGDSFYINIDAKNDYYNEMSLGDKLVLGDKVFKVEINTPESKMVLTPITENLSAVKLPEKLERLVLLEDSLKNGVMVFRPEKTVTVPEGNYRLLYYQILREDKEGDLWRLIAMGSRKANAFTAKKGGHVALEMGEPFRPIVEVPEWARSNMRGGSNEVNLSFVIRGKGDEMVADLSRIRGNKTKLPMSAKDGSRPKEPTYKIVKQDGEVAKQGQFEYG
ncbi:MAG: hypothetical protein K1Y02_07770 [Candidatus Hydrogenedentes bacterium]|nr:hypothetical protein [Candidatus Hydrogenedentota bacterium]